MARSRWLAAAILAMFATALSAGCSSSSTPANGASGADGGTGGPGGMGGDCSNAPADLCMVVPLSDLNSLCKASFKVPLANVDPFGNGSPELGFVGRKCRYDKLPTNADEAFMSVERSCFGAGAAFVKQSFDKTREDVAANQTPDSEQRTTETAAGVGEEAFYVISTDSVSLTQKLLSRQGAVAFEVTIDNAVGSQDAVKACLADVLKKVIAAAPGK